MIKKLSVILLTGLVIVLLAGCQTNSMDAVSANSSTRIFIDSTGREVEVPIDIERVAISGALTEIAALPLCEKEMVGIPSPWDDYSKKFINPDLLNLPTIGTLYGGRGDLNVETLLSLNPDVVIDIGEGKNSAREDMDRLSNTTGIPFVHIEVSLSTLPQGYRKLGELLNKPEEAEQLALYCENIYNEMTDLSKRIEKVNGLLIFSVSDISVIPKGSYHAEAFDLLADNVALIDHPSAKGTGNEVDIEQLYNWNPDIIVLSAGETMENAVDKEAWNALSAVSNNRVYTIPGSPYNWMGFPPSVQRFLGMMWMADTFYHEEWGCDLYERVNEYFKLFYHCDLTKEQFDELMAGE